MAWRNKKIKEFRLYGVTDIKKYDERILKRIETACTNGVDIIQLRSKKLTDQEMIRLGEKIRPITNKYKALFFVNDRPDLALAIQADGVHIGQDDMPVKIVRRLFSLANKHMFVGKSTHSFTQACSTAREAVDYIGVGPIFKTPTKATYKPVGTELIKHVALHIRKPFVCIGGINSTNIQKVCAAGAGRVAVVRALFSASSTARAAQQLRKIIESYGN